MLASSLLAASWAIWERGSTFYRLDQLSRIDHPDYRVLSPGHAIGHGYGMAAMLLVLFNLSYLLRRLVPRWRLGSMRLWLDLHVTSGLLTALFALSHSALQLRNPLAVITMAALGITVTTGIIGRFMHFLVPQPDQALLERNCQTFDALQPGLGATLKKHLIEAPVGTVEGRVTLLKVVRLLPKWIQDARSRKRLVFDALAPYVAVYAADLPGLEERVEETARLAMQRPGAVAIDHLIRSWRAFHRFSALLMLATMVVHASVAWYYGYRWLFSSGPAGH